MYDPKCEELADHFLQSDPTYTEAHRKGLAQYIQDSAEEWLASYREVLAERKPPAQDPLK